MAADPGTADRGREDDLVFPPEDLDELLDLARFVENHTEPGLLLGPDGEQVPLPAEVYRVLRQVVDVMRQGKATLVAPQGLLLTTQEAADFLGVSRPTLVKLLEQGAIPFEKPNRHRRVRLQDLLDFRARRRGRAASCFEPTHRRGQRARALRRIAGRLRARAQVRTATPRTRRERVTIAAVHGAPRRVRPRAHRASRTPSSASPSASCTGRSGLRGSLPKPQTPSSRSIPT